MTNKSFTIWRTILIAGTVIGLAGIVGEMVWSGDNGKLQGAEVIALATSTKITVDGAVETALGTMAGQVVEAKLEKRGDKTVWNIDILTTEEAIMTVCIDAVSGVMMLTEEKVSGKKPAEVRTL
ncbi:MAG: PepSY domain-containing protein [Nitrospira sp.]|nr:PepSY domain-containing protein [Nitrospira sp.]MDH5193213.1 PepSY domain-containing protein [Nitrospira sp.]